MRKLSKKATLHLMLQGLWKGIQEAKKDPLVQEKYPRGLDFIEELVVKVGKRAKADPNYTLSKKAVDKINQFLGGSSGVLSTILRRHIVAHCKGNQCEMVSPSEFRFKFVEPVKPQAPLNTPEKIIKSGNFRGRYSDSYMYEYQDEGESWKDFSARVKDYGKGYPGFSEMFFDPNKKLHFKFVTYNTF